MTTPNQDQLPPCPHCEALVEPTGSPKNWVRVRHDSGCFYALLAQQDMMIPFDWWEAWSRRVTAPAPSNSEIQRWLDARVGHVEQPQGLTDFVLGSLFAYRKVRALLGTPATSPAPVEGETERMDTNHYHFRADDRCCYCGLVSRHECLSCPDRPKPEGERVCVNHCEHDPMTFDFEGACSRLVRGDSPTGWVKCAHRCTFPESDRVERHGFIAGESGRDLCVARVQITPTDIGFCGQPRDAAVHPPVEPPRCQHCGGQFNHEMPSPVPKGTMCSECFLAGHRRDKAKCAKCRTAGETVSPVPPSLKPAERLLDILVRTFNKADDPESGMLEHQKQRFICRGLRPLAQQAFELLGTSPVPQTDSQPSDRSRLIQIAGAIAVHTGFVSPCGEDHSKTTPRTIIKQAQDQERRLIDWAYEIRQIADRMSAPAPLTASPTDSRAESATFNLNDEATVTLTDAGRTVWQAYWHSRFSAINEEPTGRLLPDDNGQVSTEPWQLARVFGEHFSNGGKQLFVDNAITLRRR